MAKPVTLKRHASNREGEDLVEPLPADLDLKKAKIVLYGFDLSPPCNKIRTLLNFYDVPYEYVEAQPYSKPAGLEDPSYGKVPKLVIDGRQVNDSAVIYRTLVPYLTGVPLTAAEVALEKENNIKGLMGALEKESFGSYFGIVGAARALTATWTSRSGSLVKPWLPYAAGLFWPVGWAVVGRVTPHGRDGSSIESGHKFRKALGDSPYFHGDTIGPLDLSLFGTLKSFVHMRSPPASAVLNQCGLRAWYERCDAAIALTFEQ